MKRATEIQRFDTDAEAKEKKLEDKITKLIGQEAMLKYKLDLVRADMSAQQQKKKKVKREAVDKANKIR